MEKREYTVNELFENQVLNDIYETRGDGLECIYIGMYGEPEEIKETRQAKKELENLMYELIKDKKKQKQLWLKLDRFEGAMSGEINFWNKQYYKLGFLDRTYLNKEIVENSQKNTNSNIEKLQNTFIYKNMYCLKEMIGTAVWNREDYKKIAHEMSSIKEKHPNVMKFLERNEIIELTKNELKALDKYLKLSEKIQDIEMVETFKLGIQEGNIL